MFARTPSPALAGEGGPAQRGRMRAVGQKALSRRQGSGLFSASSWPRVLGPDPIDLLVGSAPPSSDPTLSGHLLPPSGRRVARQGRRLPSLGRPPRSYICNAFDNTNSFISKQPDDSILYIITRALFEGGKKDALKINGRLLASLRHPSNDAFFTIIGLTLTLIPPALLRREFPIRAAQIAAALLDRLFESATQDVTSRRWSVQPLYLNARQAVVSLLSDVHFGNNDRQLKFSIANLLKARTETSRRLAFQVISHPEATVPTDLPTEIAIKTSDIVKNMAARNREKFLDFVAERQKFRDIFAK